MSDGSSPSPVPEETILEIGPILVGALLSWMLLGISTVQLYIYHVSFPNDRRLIQAAVYVIYLLDIFQSIVAASQAWQFLVAGWGRHINLEFPGWTFTALPIVSSLVSLGVQTFYAWRVWQLGRWRVVPCIIILTALISAGAACAVAIRFAFTRSIASLHATSAFIPAILWLGAAAVADILIMSSMLYLLYAVKQRTRPFERSEFVVNRLIKLTVETGSACAVSALVQLGLFSGMPRTNVHLVLALVLSKVYSNALMTSLNARCPKSFSPETTSRTRSVGFMSRRSQSISRRQLASPSLPPVAIHITQEVASDRDQTDDKDMQHWEIEMDDVPSPMEQTTRGRMQSAKTPAL
ncbi:hypothetical protein GSI_10301 [Ganoderma sinense ZZ0214-1]|uniref:DUF6534 domain-containing protein n=1 Tax=Ganoderma sinense ZZ0214-1 TaxID=1077348 RepID=A0A2G8S064_9APHY|nr:hypothetical protein GSI_10301 [Ganoderma sinense ZZ0214-1]